MPSLTREELLAAATAFCESFARKKPLEEILSHFSPDEMVVVHEHGLPRLAPFLGRDFRGLEGARRYFETVRGCLSYEDMRFVEFVADTFTPLGSDGGDPGDGGGVGVGGAGGEGGGGGKVAVRGRARFTWTETGLSWDETFAYLLRFDARAKLARYEVWADSGAAYLARRGEL
ncbi:transcription elongation factor S-II [Ustulina deusta]|nr:transcription elongation factor S-II [Ustulina deusta]